MTSENGRWLWLNTNRRRYLGRFRPNYPNRSNLFDVYTDLYVLIIYCCSRRFILDVDVPFGMCRLVNNIFYWGVFWSAEDTTIGVQTRRYFKVSMLQNIAASSLYNSIGGLKNSLRDKLRGLIHAGPGFSLNQKSVNKSKDVYNYLKSGELENTKLILRHDLIKNIITPHTSKNNQPQNVIQLLASLRSLTTYAA